MKATVVTRKLSSSSGAVYDNFTERELEYPEITVDVDEVSEEGHGYVTVSCYRERGGSRGNQEHNYLVRELVINHAHFVLIDFEADDEDIVHQKADVEAQKKEDDSKKTTGQILGRSY